MLFYTIPHLEMTNPNVKLIISEIFQNEKERVGSEKNKIISKPINQRKSKYTSTREN